MIVLDEGLTGELAPEAEADWSNEIDPRDFKLCSPYALTACVWLFLGASYQELCNLIGSKLAEQYAVQCA